MTQSRARSLVPPNQAAISSPEALTTVDAWELAVGGLLATNSSTKT